MKTDARFAWFRSLPPEPVIRWTSACLSEDKPVGYEFVDVEVSPLLHELEVGWIWTIRRPDENEPPGLLEVILDYDTDQGWSPIHMSDGLSRWVAENVGRDDVRFVCDPGAWSLFAWYVEDCRERAKGEDLIEMGEGVRATSEVMDTLLAMPWETDAEIIATMQQVRDRHVAEADGKGSDPR